MPSPSPLRFVLLLGGHPLGLLHRVLFSVQVRMECAFEGSILSWIYCPGTGTTSSEGGSLTEALSKTRLYATLGFWQAIDNNRMF